MDTTTIDFNGLETITSLLENNINVPRFDSFETNEKYSRILSSVKSTNTAPERILAKALWESGYRYRKNYRKLIGKPDLVFVAKKIVVFVDGDFWHGRDWETKKNKIKSNREYWIAKIERNMQRDKQQEFELCSLGWDVIRLWESDIKKDLQSSLNKIIEKINSKT